MDLLEQALTLRQQGTRFAFATVIEAEGSTPRHVGAKMIVCEDGTIFGTIGGGNLETRVIEVAQRATQTGRPDRLELALGPALGQCCGGRVTIFIEPDERPESLYLFGAGHVAKELCHMVRPLGFRVTVIDPRPEWNNPERFPLAYERLLEDGVEAIGHLKFDSRTTYCAVMTHDHRADEEIIRALFERPLRYVGLIGSKTKWARFRQRYRARGIEEAAIARVRTPIGLDLRAETPAEIAASIIGELVQVRRSPLAVAASAVEGTAAAASDEDANGTSGA